MILPALSSTIPLVKQLPECADFAKTVSPYIPQLYTLPQQVLTHFNDLNALKLLYLTTNPLITAFAFAIFFVGPVALIVAEINKNYSQIDRVWSMIPVLYNCHYALWARMSGLPTHRLDHVMAVSVLWGARLTFNYWRKGGYQIGHEDYRWVVVRKYAGRWMFLFDVLFISFGQSVSFHLLRPLAAC
jgi:steroid 5-alpha reductase family enzyme